jgi:hypothetical protein
MVILLLMPQPLPHDVYSGNTWPCFDASGASVIRLGGGGRSAAPPVQSATAAGAARGRSAGWETAAGLERRQSAPRLRWRQTFFKYLHGDGPRLQYGQQSQGPHRQRCMPLPPCPAADFVVVHTHLAFGGFKEVFNGPTAPRHPHHLLHCSVSGGEDDGGPQLGWHTGTAPHQQPAAL